MQSQQPSIDEKPIEEEPTPITSQTNEPKTQHISDTESNKIPSIVQHDAFQDRVHSESPSTKTESKQTFSDDAFEDDFDFKSKPTPPEMLEKTIPSVETVEKPKLSEKEIQLLRLQLENAEYLQLKSLLQAKINSEQFEIVKLRSHVALKNKQEPNVSLPKENKENDTLEEQELKQKLIKENAMLEQKRLSLINQIFQERVACVQLKIELAMKEIL